MKTVQTLLRPGGSQHEQNMWVFGMGTIARCLLSKSKCVEVVQELLKAGASVNMKAGANSKASHFCAITPLVFLEEYFKNAIVIGIIATLKHLWITYVKPWTP